jgi:hypothetical protein
MPQHGLLISTKPCVKRTSERIAVVDLYLAMGYICPTGDYYKPWIYKRCHRELDSLFAS